MKHLTQSFVLYLSHELLNLARKTQYQSPGLKKLSLRPASVFDIAKAEINQLSFGTLIDCIETG